MAFQNSLGGKAAGGRGADSKAGRAGGGQQAEGCRRVRGRCCWLEKNIPFCGWDVWEATMASRLEDVHSTLPAMEKYADYLMHRMHNCLAAIPQARHGMGKKAYWSIKYAAANANKQKKKAF